MYLRCCKERSAALQLSDSHSGNILYMYCYTKVSQFHHLAIVEDQDIESYNREDKVTYKRMRAKSRKEGSRGDS